MFQVILCPSSGAREYYTDGRCLWYLVLWFSGCRYDVELKVMCPVCRLPSSGAREYYTDGRCLWYLVLWFSVCRYGVELEVMCPVCSLQTGHTHTHTHIYIYIYILKLFKIKCITLIFKLSFYTAIFPTALLFSLRGTPGFCRTSFAIDTDPTSAQSDVNLKVLL